MSEDHLFAYDELFRLAIHKSTIPKTIQTEDGSLILVNPAFGNLVGYSEAELLGRKHVDFLITPSASNQDVKQICDPQNQLPGTSTEYQILIHRDGRHIPVRVAVTPAVGRDGSKMWSSTWIDVSGKRNAVEKARRQQEVLVHEAHHRVKNDLQALSGLLEIQCDKQPELMPTLRTVITQISAVANLHGLHFEQGSSVDPVSLVEVMSRSIAQTWNGGLTLTVAEQVRNRYLIADEADRLPFVLISNELLTNALKHGAGCPALRVDIALADSDLIIEIRNTGWLTDAADLASLPRHTSGLGLVRSLLPDKGMDVSHRQHGPDVVTTVRVNPPLLALQQVDTVPAFARALPAKASERTSSA